MNLERPRSAPEPGVGGLDVLGGNREASFDAGTVQRLVAEDVGAPRLIPAARTHPAEIPGVDRRFAGGGAGC